MSNLFVNGMVGARYDYNRVKNAEKCANNLTTAAGAAILTGVPAAVVYTAKKKPELAAKVMTRTGKAIEKSAAYVAEKAPKLATKAANTKAGKYVIDKGTILFNKAKGTKAGAKIFEKIGNAFNKIKSWNVTKTIANKVGEYATKFAKAPAATKGKYALIAAGAGLVLYGLGKLVANHYRKDGAIDQKYNDIEKFSQLL